MELLTGLLLFIEHHMSIPTMVVENTEADLGLFESKHCFLKSHQKYMTREYLQGLLLRGKPETIHQCEDSLEMGILVFPLLNKWVILGPFATNEWSDKKAEELLIENGIPMSHFLSYKMYRCRRVVASLATVTQAAQIMISIVSERRNVYSLKPHKSGVSSSIQVLEQYDDQIETVELRYALESNFVRCVENGDSDKAIAAWKQLSTTTSGLRYMNYLKNDMSVYKSTVLRTLCRWAAINGGVQPIIVDSIAQEFAQKMYKGENNKVRESLQLDFILEICAAVKAANSTHLSALLQKIIDYIQLNLGQALSLDTIAKDNGISRALLTRSFKSETGKTVTQYIAEQRVEKAAELLRNTRLPIQDISAYVGYQDSNYFVKVFKNYHGITPSQYRRE